MKPMPFGSAATALGERLAVLDSLRSRGQRLARKHQALEGVVGAGIVVPGVDFDRSAE